MGKLIQWNTISLDGYFEGAKTWDVEWFHPYISGVILRCLSCAPPFSQLPVCRRSRTQPAGSTAQSNCVSFQVTSVEAEPWFQSMARPPLTGR
jgi:hypothetical protein